MSTVNGNSIIIASYTIVCMYVHVCDYNESLNYSYELNLAAKDSPLKIVRHYQPNTVGDHQSDNPLRVSIYYTSITIFLAYS